MILICQILGSVGPVQQKVKLPSPNIQITNNMYFFTDRLFKDVGSFYFPFVFPKQSPQDRVGPV